MQVMHWLLAATAGHLPPKQLHAVTTSHGSAVLQAADAAKQGQAKETEAASLLLKAAAAEDAATSAASVSVFCVWLCAGIWCWLPAAHRLL